MVDMLPMPAACVDYEEAKILADYNLIWTDLMFVKQSLERLGAMFESDDNVLKESLWTSSLIWYCRCFSKGKRMGLKEEIILDLKLSGDDPLEFHRILKNIRDKHIAHSVNPLEQAVVDIQLSNPQLGKKVMAVSVLQMKALCPNIEYVRSFLVLVNHLIPEIQKKIKEYEKLTLNVANKMPLDELYAKSRGRLQAPPTEKFGKAR